MDRTSYGLLLGVAVVGGLIGAGLMRAHIGAPPAAPPPAGTPALPRAAPDHVDIGSQQAVRERLQHGWSTERDDAMPIELVQAGLEQVYRELLHSPHTVGVTLARRASQREQWLQSDLRARLLEMLQELRADNFGPLTALAMDVPRYGELFSRTLPARVIGHDELEWQASRLEDGTTVRYPAGVFRLTRYVPITLPYPVEFGLAGAGMDATLLVVDATNIAEELVRFRLSDCTVLTHRPALTKVSEAGSLLFERVRFVGFDDDDEVGAALHVASGAALLARQCRFEGGYGDAPGSGRLVFAPNAGLLARFEDCTFSGIRLAPGDLHPLATVVFDNCRITMLTDTSPAFDRRDGLVLDGCVLQVHELSAAGPPVRSLDALFPGWREALGG